jgi:hypothetical protein
MPGKRSETEYSTAELRRLLLEKYRSIRQDRIERYYQTGRAIRLFPDIETPQLSDFRSEIISDDQREKPKAPLKRRRKIFDRTFLLIEIGLIFVLGFIFITGISSLQSLNREVVLRQEVHALTMLKFLHTYSPLFKPTIESPFLPQPMNMLHGFKYRL